MRIIAFIDDQQLVKKIIKHLNLWDVNRKPPTSANDPPTEAFIIYDGDILGKLPDQSI